jgi:uncharacterized protein DUF4397
MKRFAVATAAVLTVVVWFGCGDDTNGGGGNNGPPQNKAWVRFGNLSPDAPAIDICVKQSTASSWGSPVLAANSISGGLTYPGMSKVIFIDPGASLDFRAVAPGGTCDTPVGIDLTAQTLNAHGTYTITAVGLLAQGASGPYRLQQYIEHAEAPATGKARFRFVNVIPDAPPIADGIADGGTWERSLTEAEMPFRVGASGVGIVDGYQDIDPNPAFPLTIRASPPETNLDLYTAPINFRAGVITAVWAIGQVAGLGDQRLGYFVCDEGPAADGGVTDCARSSP